MITLPISCGQVQAISYQSAHKGGVEMFHNLASAARSPPRAVSLSRFTIDSGTKLSLALTACQSSIEISLDSMAGLWPSLSLPSRRYLTSSHSGAGLLSDLQSTAT